MEKVKVHILTKTILINFRLTRQMSERNFEEDRNLVLKFLFVVYMLLLL